MAQIIIYVLLHLPIPSSELKGTSGTLFSLVSLYLPLFRPFLLPGMPPFFCSTHPWNTPDKNTVVGCHALLQGIFPAQRSNPCLLHLLHWQAGSRATLGKPEQLGVAPVIGHIIQETRDRIAGSQERCLQRLLLAPWRGFATSSGEASA